MSNITIGNVKDHFSNHASLYAITRPDYPEQLFRELAGMAPRRARAWDCATGNGQAAVSLTRYFDFVIATDASTQQIAQASRSDRICYHVATAERSAIAGASVDLVVVAQALHWFDLPAFVSEARRVMREDGVLAVWCYRWIQVCPELDDLLQHFRQQTVGPYWPPERRHVDAGYRTLELPLIEQPLPSMFIEKEWGLSMLTQYLRSWSATQRYMQQHGEDPVAAIEAALHRAWGSESERRRVRWPLVVRAGKLAPVQAR